MPSPKPTNTVARNGDGDDKDKRKSIQSVEAGVRVLEALAAANGSAALREVSAATGMSRSQAYRYLLAFVNTGFVRQDPVTSKYCLGSLALRVGLAALGQTDAVARASEALELLVETTGRTGLLTVWGERGPVIIRWVHGRRRVVASLGLGSVLPLLVSSSGHIFISYMPGRVTADVAEEEWRSSHRTSDESLEVLLRAIRKNTRAAGFATVSGTVAPGLCAISAPILDAQGEAAGSISLLARADEPLAGDKACVAFLLATSAKVSRDLGWFGPMQD